MRRELLDVGALNCSRRAVCRSTLNPALAALADGRIIAYGAMGATASRRRRPRCSRATLYGMP
jgi:hypothetical protein